MTYLVSQPWNHQGEKGKHCHWMSNNKSSMKVVTGRHVWEITGILLV